MYIQRLAKAIFQFFFIPSIFRENGIKGFKIALFWDSRGQKAMNKRLKWDTQER